MENTPETSEISISSTLSSLPSQTLLALPHEILDAILWFVGEDVNSALACIRVCHLFRDLIIELRVRSREFLDSSKVWKNPSIRRVRGMMELEKIEELRAFSERLEGDFQVAFPRRVP